MYSKTILVGRLGKDPVLQTIPSGDSVCRFSLATSEKWTSDDGQKQERTEWHNIVVWKKQGENCAEYLHKGSLCQVEGKIQSRKYEKDGVERVVYEIIANNVVFLDPKQERAKPHVHNDDPERDLEPPPANDEDVPF